MKVLVTGASGFIGSHVTRALIAAGHEVATLALPNDPLWRLRDLIGQFAALTGDLSDIHAVSQALDKWPPEACIHLAWYAEPGRYLHSPENIPALTGSLHLLRALIEAGCDRVVMVGTCAEYDTDLGFLHEDSPTRPATVYAAAKLSLKLVGERIAATSGIGFTWARIFYLYGPHEDERRVVPALIGALLKGESFAATHGEQVRDYLHVHDVASALVLLVQQHVSGDFNIASGVAVTVREVMETIADVAGPRQRGLIRFGAIPERDWEPFFICGDNRRLKTLGWKAQYTLAEGLRQTYDWWAERLGIPSVEPS